MFVYDARAAHIPVCFVHRKFLVEWKNFSLSLYSFQVKIWELPLTQDRSSCVFFFFTRKLYFQQRLFCHCFHLTRTNYKRKLQHCCGFYGEIDKRAVGLVPTLTLCRIWTKKWLHFKIVVQFDLNQAKFDVSVLVKVTICADMPLPKLLHMKIMTLKFREFIARHQR